jgi:predicted DNA-binding transcriptional regulator YafY
MASSSSSLTSAQRLLVVVQALQSGRSLNAPELAALCDCSQRTIYRDIDTLQRSGMSLHYDANHGGYRLPTRQQLPPAELTLPETLALIVLGQQLGDTRQGIPFQAAARQAIHKLVNLLPAGMVDRLGESAQSVQIHLDPRNSLDGFQGVYDRLVECVRLSQPVRMSYQSLSPQELVETKLSPYHLLFSRRSWYVIGRSSLHRTVRTFNLSRMRDVEVLENETFQKPARFSLDRYLGNAWHLIREKPYNQDVLVLFRPLVADNVAEVRWHKTQRVEKRADGSLEFRATVDGLNEISWWILGYGDQAEVLEPRPLRQILAKRARALAAVYEGE